MNTYVSNEMEWSGACSRYKYFNVSARKNDSCLSFA